MLHAKRSCEALLHGERLHELSQRRGTIRQRYRQRVSLGLRDSLYFHGSPLLHGIDSPDLLGVVACHFFQHLGPGSCQIWTLFEVLLDLILNGDPALRRLLMGLFGVMLLKGDA
jgi:hypothetical protein